jgi:glutaredoxin-like YruB-family protein
MGKKVGGTDTEFQAPEIILYGTPNCQYCAMAREYLEKRKIKFEEYDVSKNIEKAREMVMKSQQKGVPVLQINGRIIVGFRREIIEQALALPKLPKEEDMKKNIFFDPFNI